MSTTSRPRKRAPAKSRHRTVSQSGGHSEVAPNANNMGSQASRHEHSLGEAEVLLGGHGGRTNPTEKLMNLVGMLREIEKVQDPELKEFADRQAAYIKASIKTINQNHRFFREKGLDNPESIDHISEWLRSKSESRNAEDMLKEALKEVNETFKPLGTELKNPVYGRKKPESSSSSSIHPATL